MPKAFLALLAALTFGAGAQQAANGPQGPSPEDDNFRFAYVQIHEPYFAKVQRDGAEVYEARRPRATAGSFPARKGANTKRVFIVGGSVAGELGGAVPAESLARALPKRDVEALNCGMGGYDSYRDSLVAEEVLGYDPDLLVVLSGNNEMTHTPQTLNLTLYRAGRWLEGFGFYRALQRRLQAGNMHAGHPDPAVRLPAFEANLRRMATLARRKGVPIVLCTMPGNIRDQPPHSIPDLTDWNDPVWAAAWAALEAKQYPRAAGLFGEYAAKHPGEPHGHFYRAKALDLGGDRAGAARYYQLSKEYDTEAAGPARNRMIRSVCASEDGCILADLDEAFKRSAPDGLPGGDFFMDSMHWYFQHNAFVMAAILDAVRAHDRSGAAPVFAAAAEWGTVAPSERAGKTRWEDITPHDNPDLYAVKGVIDTNAGVRWEQSIAMFRSAYRLHPEFLTGLIAKEEEAYGWVAGSVWTRGGEGRVRTGWARVLEHAGEALRREGDLKTAQRFLDEAVRLDPALTWAYLFRALNERAAGAGAKARADFETARRRGAVRPEVKLFADNHA